MANNSRPEADIIADILKIKQSMASVNSEEKADDISVKKRTIDELKEILHFFEDELKEAQGITTENRWTQGVRRGYNV